MRVLVTGGNGQVGRELMRLAPTHVVAHFLSHEELDITSFAAVNSVMTEFAPTVVVNAAAYTFVDEAESNKAIAWEVNASAPQLLANAVLSHQPCRMIHVSTDYVFDGESPRPYREDDQTRPLSEYGRSKLEGERVVLDCLGSQAVVLRTSWVYGLSGRNFLRTMFRLMRGGQVIRVVTDQVGTPTSAASVARALWGFVSRPDQSGIHHWTDSGVASWYDFAVAIAEEGALLKLLPSAIDVQPISSEQYPTVVRRPANSVLDSRGTVATLAIRPLHWRQELRVVLQSPGSAEL